MHRRHTCRSLTRSAFHRATRVPLRTRWRAPDDLAAALAALGRALQAHRRLARLAPRFFDSVVVERERREHQARCRWRALWEPALDKVYGREPQAPPPEPALPPLPPPRTQLAVDQELAAWQFWRSTAHEALERHARRHPHALVSLTRIARLLKLGFEFARLACGVDASAAAPTPDPYEAVWADLERAYGHRSDLDSSGPASSPAPGAPEPHSPPAAAAAALGEPPRPGGTVPGVGRSVPERREAAQGCNAPGLVVHVDSPGPTAPPEPLPSAQPRRDVWSSWARHLRRRP